MPHPVGFDVRKGLLPRRSASLPAYRHKGPHTRSAIPDAAWGACGIFFPQSPSFLASPRRLHPTQGPHNVQPLVGVAPRPGDQQSRTLLEPIAPPPARGRLCRGLCGPGTAPPARPRAGPRRPTVGGPGGAHRLCVHSGALPDLSHPSTAQWPAPLLACRPHPRERLPWPSAGHCLAPRGPQAARRAGPARRGTRGGPTLAAPPGRPSGPPGRDLPGRCSLGHQPWGAFVCPHRCTGLLTGNPASHPTCSERLAFGPAHDALAERPAPHGHGRFTAGPRGRYLHAVLLRSGAQALAGDGGALPVVHATTGA
jgi:hypothetical protein